VNAPDVQVFFDEIHEIPGWEKFIRRLLEQEKYPVYITGSSSHLLSSEIATTLRGRTLTVEVFPFSFHEYLSHIGVEPVPHPASKQRSIYAHQARMYMHAGGFPESIGCEPHFHRILLQNYVDTIMYRDIIDRHQISQTHVVRELITYCLQNCSSLLSINKLFHRLKSQGKAIGKNAVYDIMAYIEDAYCLFPISVFSHSHNQRSIAPKKLYAVDQGLITAYTIKPGFEHAALLENTVFCSIRHRTSGIYYYVTHDGYEVDFVVAPAGEAVRLVQCCLSLVEPETKKREIRVLIQAMEELGLSGATIVTIDEDETIDAGEGRSIQVMPLWRWLLQSDDAYS